MAKKITKKKATRSSRAKVDKSDTIPSKGFSNVPVSSMEQFELIKAQISSKKDKKTDAETLTYLINHFNSGTNTSDNELSEQIEKLNTKVEYLDEENQNLSIEVNKLTKDLELSEQGRDSLLEGTKLFCDELGTTSLTEGIQIIKDLKVNTGSAPNEDLEALTNKLTELENTNTELTAKLHTYDSENTEVTNFKQTILPAIAQLGFNDFGGLLEDYETKEAKIKALTDELFEVNEAAVKLEGNEFVAKINDKNFNLAARYRPNLFNNKLVSGDNEDFPNELINWAIPTALRHTFAKLPEV